MMTALFIAMVTAVLVWWLLIQRLQAKPWTEHGVLRGSQEGVTSSAPKVGLVVFLCMVASLFLVFSGAYFMRMEHGHGAGMARWVPVDEPGVLWLNTAVLVLASVAIQKARGAAVGGDLPSARTSFIAAGLLTLLFLFGQLWAWQLLASSGQYTAQSPAFAFFILLTAVHGVHLIGGLIVLGRAALKMWRLDPADAESRQKLTMSVELCTAYWHFLLLVWVALFALLLFT